MTVRDVLVQIGFLMVTTGVMLAVWAVLTGQFSRAEPEAIPAEPAEESTDEPDDDFAIPSVRRRASPPRAAKPRATAAKAKTAKKAKPRPRKPRPPA